MIEVPSAEQLYETIIKRFPPLSGFEDAVCEMARSRSCRIHDYLLDRADRLDEPCVLCYAKQARRSFTRFVYDTPWDDEETEKPFCSEECADIYLYEEPYAYFWCGRCEREICEQHPGNGWHIQYREYDGETVCLRCYQEAILEDGVEREKLEAGQIPGMFFSWGNSEAKQAGYEEVPGFTDFYIHDEESRKAFRDRAIELMDGGHLVVIGYERLAIGGSEGYATLMARKCAD
jgi:hypothetical protein